MVDVAIRLEGDGIRDKLPRVVEAFARRVEADAARIVDAARQAWPVSGDNTPSRDLLSTSMSSATVAEVVNAAPYATEIRGGATVRDLLDGPLAAAAQALGDDAGRLIGEVLRG